jgi:hypothetical protein
MIVVRLMGGTGNQMFQYALGRALSLKHKCALKLDLTFLLDRTPRDRFSYRSYELGAFNIRGEIAKREEVPVTYRRYFSGRLSLVLDSLRRRMSPRSTSERQFHFDPAVLDIRDSAYVEGYWQSPKYFEDFKDVIRSEFTLRQMLPDPAEELRAQIAEERSVCVHVRRGDFVGNSMYLSLGQDYYLAGLRLVAEKIPAARVYVFSDDIDWCRANLRFSEATTYVDDRYAGPAPAHHLALMSACRAFVISNSTFAWWAAWLNRDPDKLVIAPKRWFLDPTINTNDLIPDTWVRI